MSGMLKGIPPVAGLAILSFAAMADPLPPDATYRVGTCAAGWIPFPDVARLADVESIRYKNGVGDVAEWRVGP